MLFSIYLNLRWNCLYIGAVVESGVNYYALLSGMFYNMVSILSSIYINPHLFIYHLVEIQVNCKY
jgi:hypothetical protein